MKKVLAIVLSVAMLACFAIPALAADPLTIDVGEYTAQPGDAVQVLVKLSAGSISAANFVVTYDKDVLEFTKFQKVGITSDADSAIANDTEDGLLIALAASAPQPSGDLFQLNFTVKADAELGTETAITITADNITVAEGATNVDVLDQTTFNNGKIVIAEATSSEEAPISSEETPVSSEETPVSSEASQAPASSQAPATSTNNPKTGDAGVAVFAAIVAAAAAAAFVAGKKKA